MSTNKLPTVHEPNHTPAKRRYEQAIYERLWLTYFNDTLLAQGVITGEEHDKMRVRINNRTISAKR